MVALAFLAFVAVTLILRAQLRPHFHVGSTVDEVRSCLQAEEKRRMPPYATTCSVCGNTTNVWLVGTRFYLRDALNPIACRSITLTFSTNGVVTDIRSKLECDWSSLLPSHGTKSIAR